jgi:hypothetical protein
VSRGPRAPRPRPIPGLPCPAAAGGTSRSSGGRQPEHIRGGGRECAGCVGGATVYRGVAGAARTDGGARGAAAHRDLQRRLRRRAEECAGGAAKSTAATAREAIRRSHTVRVRCTAGGALRRGVARMCCSPCGSLRHSGRTVCSAPYAHDLVWCPSPRSTPCGRASTPCWASRSTTPRGFVREGRR